MTSRSKRQSQSLRGAWRLEQLAQAARRTVAARRPAASPAPPPAAPPPSRRQDVALAIINAGRKAHGVDALKALPERGPEQPRVGPIDATKLAAEIVAAGDKARMRL